MRVIVLPFESPTMFFQNSTQGENCTYDASENIFWRRFAPEVRNEHVAGLKIGNLTESLEANFNPKTENVAMTSFF